MQVTVTIQAVVKPNVYEEFEEFLTDNLPNVRAFVGALNVSILFNQQTNDFLIYEEWSSEAHHQAYIKAISENGVMGQLALFFEDVPTIKYYVKKDI